MHTFLKSALITLFTLQYIKAQTQQPAEQIELNSTTQPEQQTPTNEETSTRTFLVKTTLTQQELEDLLNNKTRRSKGHVYRYEVNDDLYQNQTFQNQTELDQDPFQKELQREIKQDSLHPLDEFHVTEVTQPKQQTENSTVLLTKTKNNIFNSLYEKKFGKMYGFIVLILVIIGIFMFHNLSLKDFGNEYNKDCFYYGNKEYMLKNY